MHNLKYLMYKAVGKIKNDRKQETLQNYFRKCGMKIGNNSKIYSNIVTTESHLISIGNNVTIAGNVEFVTHDNSISKVLPNTTDLFGKIEIGDNCFIGERTLILYGVSLVNNIIVAAGSIVASSFEESNIIIGGVPAKKIGTWEKFAEKNKDYAWNLWSTSREEMVELQNKGIKLIKR